MARYVPISQYVPRTDKYVPTNMTFMGTTTIYNQYWYTTEYATVNYAICLPNCTVYVLGRLAEIAQETVKQGYGSQHPLLNRAGFGDATWWYDESLWEYSQTPRVGSVACWSDSHSPTDPAYWGGHVAVVEETDGTLANTKLSMSGYDAGTGTRTFTNPGITSPEYFNYRTFATTNYLYTTYNNRQGYFRGFLVNPYVIDTPPRPNKRPLFLRYDGGDVTIR